MTQQTPKGKTDFCTMCRQNTGYTLKKQSINKIIKGVEYSFKITVAVCNECGGEMGVPGLIDRNIREIDEQYRAYEGIVSIADIDRIMKIYKIGKAPLSLALGFGEITITRYLAGQIPSKEYSDILRRALSSPSYMKEKLWQNKDKIAQTAYHKAMEAAVRLDDLFSVSDTMLQVISYILSVWKRSHHLCFKNCFILCKVYPVHCIKNHYYRKTVRLGCTVRCIHRSMICFVILNLTRSRMHVLQFWRGWKMHLMRKSAELLT